MKSIFPKLKKMAIPSLLAALMLSLAGCGPGYYVYDTPSNGSFSYMSPPPPPHHGKHKKKYKRPKPPKPPKHHKHKHKGHHHHHHDD